MGSGSAHQRGGQGAQRDQKSNEDTNGGIVK
jgi:hypothetical protein